MASQITDDKRAIEALIRRQFESLQWAPDRAGDWDGFTADFHPEATLSTFPHNWSTATAGSRTNRPCGRNSTVAVLHSVPMALTMRGFTRFWN